MNLFQNLVSIDELCSDTLIQAVVGTVNNALTLIQIAVPIVLIVFCTIDMFKAFTNGDEKERSKAWKGAVKRIIFAVIVFIVPWLVKLGLSLLGKLVDTNGEVNGFETFVACWDNNVNSDKPTEEKSVIGYCNCKSLGGDISEKTKDQCDSKCSWQEKE